MAARSKAYVWGRLIAGIAGSNPARGMFVFLSCVLCVVRVLCVGLITRLEDSDRVWLFWVWRQNLNNEET